MNLCGGKSIFEGNDFLKKKDFFVDVCEKKNIMVVYRGFYLVLLGS